MKALAPCKVILFGEHAVVYDKRGIATAIGEGTTVETSASEGGIMLRHPFSNGAAAISRAELLGKLERFNQLYTARDFARLGGLTFQDAMHVVIAETMRRFGFDDLMIDVRFEGRMKGIGRSASVYSAIATAVSAHVGAAPQRKEISEIAYLGDVVSHAGMPSGIDTSTVTFGNYLSYKKSEGPIPLKIKYSMPLLLIDSGEPGQTKAAIAHVAMLRRQNPEEIGAVMDRIDGISEDAIKLLRRGDLEGIGELADENNSLLRQLGISTPKLDEIISIAKQNGARGAKITGAGKGGCAIAITGSNEDSERLRGIYLSRGYNAIVTSVGVEGARVEE
ncbi:MAG: mevalonate kinase [Candidatus Micrarchaeota archaeon]|nr:mevalonate kinase [Candidatus Micrarchaeota archaeon]MDE1804224.1 mevalonate kinase [Candidatus Micrarchaeota archaeon]MDE1846680.1 mevalonate kinase [Candidatus Micrarchaeota archaeon]